MDEIEIAPGVFMTDYRNKASRPSQEVTSAYIDNMKPVSAEEFIARLVQNGENTPPLLEEHRKRLELSIEKLKESNDILRQHADDPDCIEAYHENLFVLDKQQAMLDAVIQLLADLGGLYL